MKTTALAADENLATHLSWVQGQAPGMSVIRDSGLVAVDCGLPCDTFNVVCRTRLPPEEAPGQIQQVLDWYAVKKHPFSWWVGPADQPAELGALLESAGLVRDESELAMALHLDKLDPEPAFPPDLDVRRVRKKEELMQFAAVNAANWSPPDPHVIRFYESAAAMLLAPHSPFWFYVGYVDDVPVAASELTVGGGVVGLYNISTVEAFRRRGIGTALTLRPLLDARTQGHRTAVLQAAADGVGVYGRIGFQTFGRITEYKPKPPVSADDK